MSRWQVSRTVRQHQAARVEAPVDASNSALPAARETRGSKLDAFQSMIDQLLQRYPHIKATRIFEELKKQGYTGGYTVLRERIKQLRGRPNKPLVVRFETAPGAQAQMDWAEYQIDFTQEGRRRVNLFSYLLGYSRRQYLCFTERQDFETTAGQHILAFRHLQGLAASCLYDNMKVVVTRWETGQRRVDPTHRPPRDLGEQVLLLRQRFAELGEVASRFLEGLLKKQRCGKRQAQRVLLLLHAYQRDDVIAAMDRAVRYHA